MPVIIVGGGIGGLSAPIAPSENVIRTLGGSMTASSARPILSGAWTNICSVRRTLEQQPSLRQCGRCGELKRIEEFNWRRKRSGQRDNYCRPCRADYKHEHYAANRQRYIDNAAQRKRTLALERAAYLIEYFRSNPCSDCGESDPVVLEFDHQGEKLFTIGQDLCDRNWTSILNEIAKCEVVCANCHRRRTARRRGHIRAAVAGS